MDATPIRILEILVRVDSKEASYRGCVELELCGEKGRVFIAGETESKARSVLGV